MDYEYATANVFLHTLVAPIACMMITIYYDGSAHNIDIYYYDSHNQL